MLENLDSLHSLAHSRHIFQSATPPKCISTFLPLEAVEELVEHDTLPS